jgi:hypothetical protein
MVLHSYGCAGFSKPRDFPKIEAMFLSRNKSEKYIVRIVVALNLPALQRWLRSGEVDVSVIPYAKWKNRDGFKYQISILPVTKNLDWFFHKNANEYSHSLNAEMDISQHLITGQEFQGLEYLEIEHWRGQLAVSVCRKLILMAPLSECLAIASEGKTSIGQWDPQEDEIEVPVAVDEIEMRKPTSFMSVHRSIDQDGVVYSNELAACAIDSPKRTVWS